MFLGCQATQFRSQKSFVAVHLVTPMPQAKRVY